MSRPARAHINLDALGRNYRKVRSLHGGRALAVLKADAYGHGALPCALSLEGKVDGFAVAFTEEAMLLRSAGVKSPILLLEGVFSEQELRYAHSERLWTVIHHEDQIRMLESAHLPSGSMGVWLKVDSGMNRAGLSLSHVRAAHERLSRCASISHIVLMTHFSRADEPDSDTTRVQIRKFDRATEGLVGDRSLCNSAGTLGWSDARRDWARCGIALYGADPMPQPVSELEPVMQLEGEIFTVRNLEPGDAVGYGGTFVAQEAMRIGLVAMGYADGYPRAAGTGTPVMVDGIRTKIVGRVSMDMVTVDITNVPDSGIGSIVEFWGSEVNVNEVAMRANTIAYEVLCNVKRVRKIYRSQCR